MFALVSLGIVAATSAHARALETSSAVDGALIPVADWGDTRHGRTDWHWRYRAAYMRWLHNEYVRAGYPVHHYRRRQRH
jgi:hypothetical protein